MFHCSLSCHLLINQESCKTICQILYVYMTFNLTHQYDVIPASELPTLSMMSEYGLCEYGLLLQ